MSSEARPDFAEASLRRVSFLDPTYVRAYVQKSIASALVSNQLIDKPFYFLVDEADQTSGNPLSLRTICVQADVELARLLQS